MFDWRPFGVLTDWFGSCVWVGSFSSAEWVCLAPACVGLLPERGLSAYSPLGLERRALGSRQ
jgi:hypothetical protein